MARVSAAVVGLRLRLQLTKDPQDFELTRSLVILLRRVGSPPIPDAPKETLDAKADVDEEGARLLQRVNELAQAGDTCGVYTILWQIVVRYPRSARGWAEFARAFADRGEWEYCRAAVRRALALNNLDNVAIGDVLLHALGAMAEFKELGDLPWDKWLARQTEAIRSVPGAVKLRLRASNLDVPVAVGRQLVHGRPDNPDAWLTAAKVAYEHGNYRICYDYTCRALELDLRGTLNTIIREFSGPFARTIANHGKRDEFADWISERSRGDDVNLIAPLPSPESLAACRRLRSNAMERGLPSALLISQGKSGSVTIGNIFSSGFQLPTVLYSVVSTRIVESWLQDFLRGGASYVTHLGPTARNIELLQTAGASNLIVHVRDPRQALVSLIHHYRRYPEQLARPARQTLIEENPQHVLRYLIDKIFKPSLIQWIDGWYKARSKLNINFTTFEEFVHDRARFTERIISLYGGDIRFFDSARACDEHAGIDYHKRLGAIDEWRTVLSLKEVDEVNSVIPEYFWDTFGWKP